MVRLSTGQAVALGGLLLGSLLVAAFLLGRESARSGRPQEASGLPAPAALPPEDPPVSPAGAPDPGAVRDAARADADAPPTPPPVAGTGAPTLGERDAVARYFAESERIQAVAKTWSDPTALANSILKRGQEGDTSGFDELLASQRLVRERMAALAVPQVCREHHRRTLEALAGAGALLETLRGSLSQGTPGDVMSLMSAAHGLEAKARDVDALAAEIKRQYGLAP